MTISFQVQGFNAKRVTVCFDSRAQFHQRPVNPSRELLFQGMPHDREMMAAALVLAGQLPDRVAVLAPRVDVDA